MNVEQHGGHLGPIELVSLGILAVGTVWMLVLICRLWLYSRKNNSNHD